MFASGRVEITSTGRVIGNIQTDSLVISPGGFFNGNVTKIDADEDTADAEDIEPEAVLRRMQRS